MKGIKLLKEQRTGKAGKIKFWMSSLTLMQLILLTARENIQAKKFNDKAEDSFSGNDFFETSWDESNDMPTVLAKFKGLHYDVSSG